MLENTISNGSHLQPIALPPILAFVMGVPVAPREAVERKIERAIEALDEIDGDLDLEHDLCNEGEPAFGVADRAICNSHNYMGAAGCNISDPGGCEHDGREPDHDDEVETWAHWMDHPPEVQIGHRIGHTDQAPRQ
jgi:hypothetical protein